MDESSVHDNNEPNSTNEEGYFPHTCPICGRINGRRNDDYCAHYWGATYDWDFIDGDSAQDFESAWEALDDSYQHMDEKQVALLDSRFRAATLIGVMGALVDGDKFWWVPGVRYKVAIEPQASPASGSGWWLYEEHAGSFDATLRAVRQARDIAAQVTAEPNKS